MNAMQGRPKKFTSRTCLGTFVSSQGWHARDILAKDLDNRLGTGKDPLILCMRSALFLFK